MTDLERLAADLAELREDVDYLASIVEPGLVAAPPNSAPAPPPLPSVEGGVEAQASRAGIAHVWHTLAPDEADLASAALAKWVDWLSARYTLDDTIPTCWYRHGAMVDELDALRAAWTAAYLDPHARPIDATYWLESLDRAVMRLHIWDRYGCTAGTHQDDTTGATRSASGSRASHLNTDIDTRLPARPLYAVTSDPPVDR
ncbi:MAG TPA: hypothetical protein VG899_08865 [Mycobacteriales bacterium]|nr:hypothetical protein [Mycobacteriales bacterium]